MNCMIAYIYPFLYFFKIIALVFILYFNENREIVSSSIINCEMHRIIKQNNRTE